MRAWQRLGGLILLRNWIIRARASVGAHLVTKCHSEDHNHQWVVTGHVTNERPRWGQHWPIRGRDSICQSGERRVTAWQWWPVVRDRGSACHNSFVSLSRALSRRPSPLTPRTLSRMCCVVTQCLRALLVSDKHLTLAHWHCRQDVYCNGNHPALNFHLFKFIETDRRGHWAGSSWNLCGAVQYPSGRGFIVFIHYYLQEALSQNLNSEISVCTDNTCGG